jgi:hypothetical protein
MRWRLSASTMDTIMAQMRMTAATVKNIRKRWPYLPFVSPAIAHRRSTLSDEEEAILPQVCYDCFVIFFMDVSKHADWRRLFLLPIIKVPPHLLTHSANRIFQLLVIATMVRREKHHHHAR